MWLENPVCSAMSLESAPSSVKSDIIRAAFDIPFNCRRLFLPLPEYFSAAGAAPIAFGDFSYYWIIQRQPLTIKILKDLYIISGEIGITGYERLDGKSLSFKKQ